MIQGASDFAFAFAAISLRPQCIQALSYYWAATNGGVTNGGLRGVWPPFLEIGRNRPFSAFFALFRRVRRAPGKSRKRRKKALFLRYPQICLSPHLLNPHLRHPKSKKASPCRKGSQKEFLEELFKACPVQFGALPAAAQQLFTKTRCRGPKSNRNSGLFPGSF